MNTDILKHFVTPLPAPSVFLLFCNVFRKRFCLRPCPATDPKPTKACSTWAWCPGGAQGRLFPFSPCLLWDGDSDMSPTSSPKHRILFYLKTSPERQHFADWHLCKHSLFCGSTEIWKYDKPWVMVKPARYTRTQTSVLMGPEIPGGKIPRVGLQLSGLRQSWCSAGSTANFLHVYFKVETPELSHFKDEPDSSFSHLAIKSFSQDTHVHPRLSCQKQTSRLSLRWFCRA